ncbi:MAG TPA: TolC family protein [Lacunisphaera sp.]|jgi:outer membrane protein TolC|nr:TolC family protein [Lacunisphaera sp.]
MTPFATAHGSLCRVLSLAVVLSSLGACAQPPAPPAAVNAADNAAAIAARSLQDPGLRDFLQRNLGQVPKAWDLDALSWAAFYFHPSLAVARSQWAAAQAESVTAAARPNPVLGLVPGYSTNAPAGTSPWFPAVSLDFLLPMGRTRATRVAAAQLAAEAARLDLVATVWEVRSELHQALLEWSAATRHSALLETEADLQRQLAALAQKRLDAGAAAAPEVAVIRSAALRAGLAAAEAARQVPAARARVAAALGVPLTALDDLPLAPSTPPGLTPADIGAARTIALQHRADVLAALARCESARSSLALELSGINPDVHLGPGFQWDQGQDKWSASFSFELPIFNRHEGPIALARARFDEAAARLTSVQAHIIAELDEATANRAAASAQGDLLRQLQAALDRQEKMAEARLRSGGADRSEYLNARSEAVAGRIALADADAALARAEARVEDALQVPFAHLDALTPPAAGGPSSSP